MAACSVGLFQDNVYHSGLTNLGGWLKTCISTHNSEQHLTTTSTLNAQNLSYFIYFLECQLFFSMENLFFFRNSKIDNCKSCSELCVVLLFIRVSGLVRPTFVTLFFNKYFVFSANSASVDIKCVKIKIIWSTKKGLISQWLVTVKCYDSPRFAVMRSWSLGFFFLGRPFCRGGGAVAPLK